MNAYDFDFTALKNVVTAAAKGQSKVYKSAETVLLFFSKCAPAKHPNGPESYAREVGGKRVSITRRSKSNSRKI